MKNNSGPRAYNMKSRAAKARGTELRVMQSVRDLWKARALTEITLEQVAEKAEVSVRTVLRKFGSKEELIAATIRWSAREDNWREPVEPGNLKSAIAVLLKDYETMGDAVIRSIRLEDEIPSAKEILKVGRAKHRAWCEEVFAPYLPEMPGAAREEKLVAFIAATEVYLWKLLRRDLKKSRKATYRIFLQMVEAIAHINPTQ